MAYVSPFAVPFPQLPPVPGVRMAATNCGMRYKTRKDLVLFAFDEGTHVAGVFTSNTMPGVPVDWCRSILKYGKARALVANAGIANVFTGIKGMEALRRTVQATCDQLNCAQEEVYISSTGIIGVPVKDECIVSALPSLQHSLVPQAWEDAARAIMTTDTFPKGISRTAIIEGKPVTLVGITKGSGMIAPNMATMLGYVMTDAHIPHAVLQSLLTDGVNRSYNATTVDSDTSTSDMVLLFATGKAGHGLPKDSQDSMLNDFREKLFDLLTEMALLVVKDGEGITKFITVNVKGARSEISARTIGLAIANSPLVKTAVAGEDPNWGRLIMAVGKSGEPSDRDKTSVWIGDVLVAENGLLHPDYREEQGAAHMKQSHIVLTVDVGVGSAGATVWTSDLTYEYIRINADYRS